MSNKNYNRLALQGIDIDDMEFVEEFKLNPQLAYTPKINDAVLDAVYERNIKGYTKQGISLDKAKSAAGRLRAEAKKEIQTLL
jgi:hypothetical protein